MNNYHTRKTRFLYFFVFTFSLFNCDNVMGQETKEPTAKNTFYGDFASKDVYYSVNWDHIFHSGKKLNWSYRLGGTVLNNAVALPLGINLFTGKNTSHAEFSLTLIPYVDHLNKSNTDKYLYIEPGIGYRYQKKEGGLFFKAVFTPIIFLDPPSNDFWNMDPQFYAGGNIGIGYTIPSKK